MAYSDALRQQYATFTTAADLIDGVLTNQTSISVSATGGVRPVLQATSWSDDTQRATIYLNKTRGSIVGDYTIINSGDTYGDIIWRGGNGTGLDIAARINCVCAETPSSSNDMPGTLVFSTTADGSSTLTERMRISSAGNVGIGRTNPNTLLHMLGADPILTVQDSGTSGATADARLRLAESDGSGNVENYWDIHYDGGPLTFNWGATEVSRFDANGNFFVGTTTANPANSNAIGTEIFSTGLFSITRDQAPPVNINRKTNDGNLIEFYREGNIKAAISVSGETVSYGAFCGSHWSQMEDGSKPDIKIGTVLESVNALCIWPNESNERLPKVKISSTARSKSVYGVFMSWDEDWTSTNDLNVASLGAYFCRVAAGTVLQIGDYLESAGNGFAQVQADDILRSSTIGKVISTENVFVEADGSFCIPTTLHCG